eukprot:Gb_28871 [translate_table: standard]
MGMDLTKGSIRNPSVHRPSVTGRVSFRAKAFGQMSPTWVEDFFIVVHKPLNCMVHEIEAKGVAERNLDEKCYSGNTRFNSLAQVSGGYLLSDDSSEVVNLSFNQTFQPDRFGWCFPSDTCRPE